MYDIYDYYEYGEEFGAAAEAGVASFAVAFLIAMFFASAISITVYIFNAVGYYKMAKRLNIPAPALAFVPIANIYLMGRVAQEPVYGKKKLPYGWILLGLNILTTVVAAITFGGTLSSILIYGESLNYYYMVNQILIRYLIGLFATSVVGIVYTVFYYLALYNVYKAFSPDNATLFTVLSVLFSILPPFLVFAIRNNPIGGGFVPPVNGGYGNGYNGNYGSGYGNAGYNQNFNNGFAQNSGYNPNFNNGYAQNSGFNQNFNNGYASNSPYGQNFNNGYNPNANNGYNPVPPMGYAPVYAPQNGASEDQMQNPPQKDNSEQQ